MPILPYSAKKEIPLRLNDPMYALSPLAMSMAMTLRQSEILLEHGPKAAQHFHEQTADKRKQLDRLINS